MSLKQEKALTILSEAVDLCNNLFEIKDAYLYGSYARGDYDNESDIDIFLTVDMDNTEISKYFDDVAVVCSDLSLKYDVTVSIVVKSIAQFNMYLDVLPYYQSILKDGIRYGV